MSTKKRSESDPELREILAGSDDDFVERLKELHRDRLARHARENRRRARLRRLTFGVLGR